MKSTIKRKSDVVIEGEGFDEWGKRYLKFTVVGSNHDIPPWPVEQLVKEPKRLFAALANAGWKGFTTKARNELLERLQNRKHKAPRFRVVTRLGWNGKAYVLPDETFGETEMTLEKAFSDLDPAMLTKYRAKATLPDWQDQVAALCKGNSRLMFSICLAFTGPILPFVKPPKGGGFQIWGNAETGKTTAAIVAGSVWGCHRSEGRRERGSTESWNSTAGKVEVTALAHNDTLLILDETKRAGAHDRERAKIVTSVAFGLAEMTEKERLTNQGSARSWRCFFLSTSNLSLAQLGRLGNVEIDEAHRGRMADIPLPSNGHGIYERLHGFATGEALSDALQRRSRLCYGTPAREFIRKLVQDYEDDAPAVKKFLNTERRAYRKALRRAVGSEGLKPLSRSSGRYATVFAAGSMAAKYGIVDWNRKKILKAVLRCELDQLRQPDEDDVSVERTSEAAWAKLVQYLSDNRKEFWNLNRKRPRLGRDKLDAVPGYRVKDKGKRWYYITAARFNAILGAEGDARSLKQVLAKEGYLEHKNQKYVVQRPIFTGGKGRQNYAWVHAISSDLLEQDGAAAKK